VSDKILLALTGFMGVGKSSVARHLSQLIETERVDLDTAIENGQGMTITEFIDHRGEEEFRLIETSTLKHVLTNSKPGVLSLGGGTWTIPENRQMIKSAGYNVIWLESTFDHCWINIKFSRKDRPLGRSKESTRKLFQERQLHYCLADWHFIVRPDHTSYEVAREIVEQLK
jgi:shikimate kinase